MVVTSLFAALTVTSPEGLGCPQHAVIGDRLRDAGVQVRDDDDVRVRFSGAGRRRVAEIEIPGATPRRIENEADDCTSLGEATIALLTVLLDERASRANAEREAEPPRAPPPPVSTETSRPLRIEGGAIASAGLVAPHAAGIAIGAAYRVSRWISLGIAAEGHPEREFAFASGVIHVAAASGAVVGCAGTATLAASIDACVLGHAGIYALSAEGFPVVDSAERPLLAIEPALRLAYFIVPSFGVFIRGGAWIPFTRFDVGVRGAEPAFSSTAIGPKALFGLEIRP